MSNGLFGERDISSGSSQESNDMASKHGNGNEETGTCMVVIGDIHCNDIDARLSSRSKATIPTRDENLWNFITNNKVFRTKIEEKTGNGAKFSFNHDVHVKWDCPAQSTEDSEKWVDDAAKKLEDEIRRITVKTFPLIIEEHITRKYKDIEANTFGRQTLVVGYKETLKSIEECVKERSVQSATCSTSQYTFTVESTKYMFIKSWHGLQEFKTKYPDQSLSFDDEMYAITHSWSQREATTAKKEIKELLKGITIIPLKVEKGKRQFLQKKDVLKCINEKLLTEKLGTIFYLGKIVSENLVVVAETPEKAKKSEEALSKYIKEKNYKQSQTGIDLSGIRFSRLQEQLPNRSKCCLYPVRSKDRGTKENEVHLICIAEFFEEADTFLQSHLQSGSGHTERSLYLPVDQYRFIKKVKLTDLRTIARIHEVDINVNKSVTCDDNDVCLVLCGKHSQLVSVEKHIKENILQGIKTSQEKITRSHHIEFLRDHGYRYCRALGKELGSFLHIKDENKDLQWQVCGKHVVLSGEQNVHANASIVTKPINLNSGQKENMKNANITGEHSQNNIDLLVPYKRGSIVEEQFLNNIAEVFDTLSHKKSEMVDLEITEEYFTDQTEGDFLLLVLDGLQRHTQRTKKSSLREITFSNLNTDCLRAAKTILETFVSNHEDERGYAEEWRPVIYITGPKKTVQNISLKSKIDEAIQRDKLAAENLEGTGQGTSNTSKRKLQERPSVEDSSDAGLDQSFQLRKVDDSRITVADAQIILNECPKSVGLISTGHEEGTCFRIGHKYIGTALHVVAKKLDSLKSETWAERDKVFSDDVRVMFDYKYKDDRRQHQCFQLRYDPVFISYDLDFVILELIDNGKLPKPLWMSCSTSPSRFHSIGHPNSEVLTADTNCEVIENDRDIITKAITHVEKKYGTDRAKSFNDDLKHRSEDYFLCHSFSEFGSSGSPVFIIEKDHPKVVGILCKGTPGFYHDLPKSEQEYYPNHFMFEKVTKMQAIYSRMKDENQALIPLVFDVQADTSMNVD